MEPKDAVLLGYAGDGGALSYSSSRYQFFVEGAPIELGEVRQLDREGKVRWRFLEHRDWLRRIDGDTLDRCRSEAARRFGELDADMSPQDRAIADHVRRDDSYIHGYIVDTDAEEIQRRKKEDQDEREDQETKAVGLSPSCECETDAKGKKRGFWWLRKGKEEKGIS